MASYVSTCTCNPFLVVIDKSSLSGSYPLQRLGPFGRKRTAYLAHIAIRPSQVLLLLELLSFRLCSGRNHRPQLGRPGSLPNCVRFRGAVPPSHGIGASGTDRESTWNYSFV
jgi:hypothetical protein